MYLKRNLVKDYPHCLQNPPHCHFPHEMKSEVKFCFIISCFQLHHTQMRSKNLLYLIKKAFKDRPQDHKPTQIGLTPWWIKTNEGKRPRRGFLPSNVRESPACVLPDESAILHIVLDLQTEQGRDWPPLWPLLREITGLTRLLRQPPHYEVTPTSQPAY